MPALRTTGTVVVAALLLAGCAQGTSYRQRQALYDVQQGKYADAAARINGIYGSSLDGEPADLGDSPSKGTELDEKHLLLWRMERGAISGIADDLPAASRHLDDAAALVDIRRTKGLVREGATYLVNDTVREYAGFLYEHAQVDVFRLLNEAVQAQRAEGHLAGPTDGETAEFHWSRALVRARHLAQEVLPETRDATAGADPYQDDPWGRVLAASMVLAMAPSMRGGSDDSFAAVQLRRALQAYDAERARLAADKHADYQVKSRPAVAEALWLAHLHRYDPEGLPAQARELGIPPERVAAAAPQDGQGLLLVLNQVDFIAKPEVLAIGVGTIAPAVTGKESAQGVSTSTFSTGGFIFWCKGPGADVVFGWPWVPMPTEVMKQMTPGGMAVIGFQIPVHPKSAARPAPARLNIDGRQEPLSIASDLDAYARATLKHEQPRQVAKTLARLVAKQAAVAVTARSVKEANTSDSGAALALAINLIGSALMTYTEQADIRAWSTLPRQVEAVLVALPAGEHRLTLETPRGPVALPAVTVTPGRLSLLPVRTFSRDPLPPVDY